LESGYSCQTGRIVSEEGSGEIDSGEKTGGCSGRGILCRGSGDTPFTRRPCFFKRKKKGHRKSVRIPMFISHFVYGVDDERFIGRSDSILPDVCILIKQALMLWYSR
jgi:hypothetical protein